MSRTLATSFTCAIAVLLIFVPASSPSQVIDFETLPGGGSTVDQQTISTEYASLGVTFTLLDHTTGLPIGFPRIAKAGAPLTAFEGCAAPDTPYPYLGLGQSVLTDGTGLGVEGDLLIEYSTPVAAASGLILDIDCRVSGGPPCEQWTITAFDTNGAVLDSLVLDGPPGAENPGCASPHAGPGDSEAFGWSFGVGTPTIKSIIIRHTGAATNVGLAFDNFALSSEPQPLDVVATSPVDTVCTGESLTLSAFPTGGTPPYTFQWQQKVNPATWLDLGTGATQDVVVPGTTRYRVTVTDALAAQVTSAEIAITASSGLLCDASLLVSSNTNSSVVRYSFQSQQPEVFVASGSGGLNSTSKAICGGGDGNLYVSSQANHRVLRYDGVTGAFIDIFVAGGSGGLSFPVGLDFGPDGNLYVVSNGNHSVLRYDGTTGAFIDAFVPNGSGLNTPTGMIFGPDNHLYVCSRDSDKVLRFDGTTAAPLGDFVTAGSGGLDAPRGLAFGPDGNLYIGEEINDSVRRYHGTTGAFIDVFVSTGSGGLDRANDIAFGPDNVLYVASFNSNQVLGYDATTGTLIGALPDGILNGPAWLTVGCHPTTTAARNPTVPPLNLSVEPNVPNPFNPWTRATFTLSSSGRTRVTVVDVAGRIVATLLDRPLTAGRHAIEWNGGTAMGGTAPSGVYFLRVESSGRSATRKITLVR